MQLNAKKCHTKEGSVTVDVGLVEVDRGESRFLVGSCGWSRGCGVRGHFGKCVCRTQRCGHEVHVVNDDLNRGEFVGPFPFVVSEDEHNGAILDEITRVADGGLDVVGDEMTVLVELGH